MSMKEVAVDRETGGVSTNAVRTLAWLARWFESDLGELELTLPQYRLLSFLETDDWAASALADRLRVSRPSITALVDGLVHRLLVERVASDEDRRRVVHVITAAGRKAVAEADQALARRVEDFTSRLEPARCHDAHEGLEALAEALDRARRERYSR